MSVADPTTVRCGERRGRTPQRGNGERGRPPGAASESETGPGRTDAHSAGGTEMSPTSTTTGADWHPYSAYYVVHDTALKNA